MSAAGYYGTLASYFGQSGGTGSPGKSGGAGYSNDAPAYLTSGSGASGDQTAQSPSASSGSGWISAAASTASTDKSQFITPFQQSFGGITNNQIIASPGAVGANAPIGPSGAAAYPFGGGSSSPSPIVVIGLVLLALVAGKMLAR
ncbi:MAG TPA: hypothetical protein VFA39_18990 [Steroidobacteraceae bacterium]|nr:hypothetical protein [Steroidobacteraceae bacterium]